MAAIDALRTELTTDPLGRGYSGMTAGQAAASLNAVNRDVQRQSLSGDQVFNAADPAELAALGTPVNIPKLQLFVSFCAREHIDPFGATNVRLLQEIFGNGSTTLGRLANLRTEPNSRGVEIGFGRVGVGDVEEARAG